MDEVRLNNISHNGPGIWNLLHSCGINAVDDKTKNIFEYIVVIVRSRLKCDLCIMHFDNFLQTHPLKQYRNIISVKGTHIGYFQWSVELHNAVNTKLGKKLVSLPQAYHSYNTNISPICHSCGDLPY